MNRFDCNKIDFLRKNYPKYSLLELAEKFNQFFSVCYTVKSIRNATRNHAIKSGRSGRFEKSAVPWNKNKKGFMGANKTSFKSGQIPHNTKQIGSERIDTKDGYIWIKVDEKDPHSKSITRYRLKQRVLWEAAHGPVPKGKVIKFIDGNKLNCTIENMILVDRKALVYLNHEKFNETPDTHKLTHILTAQIRSQI